MGDRAEGFKKSGMGGVWEVPDDLHCSVPKSVQLRVLIRIQLENHTGHRHSVTSVQAEAHSSYFPLRRTERAFQPRLKTWI